MPVLDKELKSHYNNLAIGVWRSLVSRLVRVQEASGSNPDTPTSMKAAHRAVFIYVFIFLLVRNDLIVLKMG